MDQNELKKIDLEYDYNNNIIWTHSVMLKSE